MSGTQEQVDTRTKLMDVAAEMFARQGFDGTGVQAIVEAAGFTKPVLYYHFKSKEDLAHAILEDLLEEVKVLRQGILTTAPSLPKALERYIHEVLDYSERKKGALTFAFSLRFMQSALVEKLVGLARYDLEAVEEWKKFVADHGHPESADAVVEMLWALLIHESTNLLLGVGTHEDRANRAKALASRIMRGALNKESR